MISDLSIFSTKADVRVQSVRETLFVGLLCNNYLHLETYNIIQLIIKRNVWKVERNTWRQTIIYQNIYMIFYSLNGSLCIQFQKQWEKYSGKNNVYCLIDIKISTS